MIVLPYGHDQSVYGRQWATYALIALNALVFGYTAWAEQDADRELDGALSELFEARLRNPDASIDPSVFEGAPRHVRDAFASVVTVERDASAPLTDGDLELEEATRDVLDAVERRPSYELGYRPGDPSVLTLGTSMFVHGDIWHLLGNMLFLWLAGAVIECFWKRGPFLALYLVAGACGTLAHHAASHDALIPVVGASGAIAGLLGAFVVGYPRTRIRVLYALIPIGIGHFYVRAWILIPAWALYQLACGLLDDGDAGVAYWSHVGGFAVGVAGAILMRSLGWLVEDAGDGTARR